jgi:hypothetical protein
VPAIGLGLILLPLFLSRWRFGSIAAAVAIAVTYAVAAQRAISPGAVLTITVLLAAIWGATQVDLDRVPRTALAVGVVAAVLLVGALGWHEAQIYLRSRYATNDFSEPIGLVAMRLRDVHDARIAVTGFAEHYPFYGVDLSNRVEFPAQREGARFLSYSTCRDWLSALTRRRYDYVVAAVEGGHDAPAARWTRRYPGVRLLSSLQPPQRDGAGWRWQFYKLDSGGNVNPAVACETMSG